MDLGDLDPDPHRQFDAWYDGSGGAGRSTRSEWRSRRRTTDGMPVGADGAAEGPRRARLRLLHEPREPEGRASSRRIPARRSSLHWEALARQVRVEGPVERLSETSRSPTCGRARAAAGSARGRHRSRARSRRGRSSSGSTPRQSARFDGEDEIPLPPFWGGYRVVPDCDRVLAGTSRTASTTGSCTSAEATAGRRRRLGP